MRITRRSLIPQLHHRLPVIRTRTSNNPNTLIHTSTLNILKPNMRIRDISLTLVGNLEHLFALDHQVVDASTLEQFHYFLLLLFGVELEG